jgi:hypothetical protein
MFIGKGVALLQSLQSHVLVEHLLSNVRQILRFCKSHKLIQKFKFRSLHGQQVFASVISGGIKIHFKIRMNYNNIMYTPLSTKKVNRIKSN